jgi:mono/diheme cytochrome c family protein
MRRPVLALAFVLGALALGAAGCGSGEKVAPAPETVQGTLPTPTTTQATTGAEAKGNPEAGKKVFASAGCGGCHTLKAAGSSGNVGPNLDDKKPPLDLILDRVTNGKSPMPSFKDSLSKQQIADVAAFVYQSTHS